MNYVIMVSHGEFAPGLHTALTMIAGDRRNVLSTSLTDNMSADTYAEKFKNLIAPITTDDNIILLADIIGGSPLTTAANVLADAGLLSSTRIFGGMNLPMALSVVLNENTIAGDAAEFILNEAKNSIQEFTLESNETDEEI